MHENISTADITGRVLPWVSIRCGRVSTVKPRITVVSKTSKHLEARIATNKTQSFARVSRELLKGD